VKFAFIKEHVAAYPVEVACDALGVSRSGYYAWLDRPESARAKRREELAAAIARVHGENRGVYGSPRVHQALLAEGESACVNTVADIMQEQEIRAKTKRKFVPRTTDSRHEQPVVGNVLDRQFDAERPNEKWVVDITYIPTGEGWLYLAGVMDLCSRKIVGWSMADHMEATLVSDALRMAIAGRSPGEGLLHHSDRGSQYASDDYMHLLQTHGVEVSMSGVGQCWDNAAMESFWATLKTELVHHERYATREQARASIFEYMEVFYNRKRLHSSLGYVSPEQFEAGLN
jgi:transposase InsO family protein